MRNLKLVQHIEFQHSELTDTRYICVGGESGIIYCIDKGSIYGVDLVTLQIVNQVSLESEGFLDINANNVPLGVAYLLDQQLVCVATTNGDVILYNPLNKQLECVGTVESGLTAMGWSPDQELVVLTTGQNTVILMNKEFEGITEILLHPEEFGENKSITVGWGKKETQFQGSVGKQAAFATDQTICPVLSCDDLRPRVSWREDGQYFAISAVNSDNGVRKIRVWSRDGILQSTSELVDGLEQSMCWKPSGSLIASSLCRANKHEIIFFEKNGLRHGEFTLPFQPKEVEVREVLWNNDSSILAVWCEKLNEFDCKESNGCKKTYFQLWTVNNYHWYLKYNLHFKNIKLRCASWDPEHAYRLHMMCQGGKYFQYTWFWQTNHSYGCNEDDLANVAVIDGSHLLVTPFRNLIIPPPMSAYQLLLPSPVNHVMFAPPPQTNDIALVLANGKIVLYTSLLPSEGDVSNFPLDPTVKLDAAGGNGFKVQIATPRLLKIYDIALPESLSSEEPLNLHHFLWILPHAMLCVCSANNMSSLIQLDLKEKEGEKIDNGEIILNTITNLEGFVLGLCSNSGQTTVAIQLIDGAVLKYESVSESIMPWLDSMSREVQFPQPCLEMAICNLNGEDVVLGLTDRFRLYVNNIEISNNCTSFRIHDEFLLLTTHNHTLRCIHKASCKLEYLKDSQAHVFDDENIRCVERGSRLVVVVPQDTKVILQMPRGNLETIHPRTLALSVVCKHIDKLQYKKAFAIMRKHRINLNLLYDHNPKNFLQNVEQFIQQLEPVSYISLFLSDLVADDVTLSMYKMAYSQREGVKQPDKVDIICDALRVAMENNNPNRYLLAILTAHTRKSKPELDLALMKIKALRDNNESQTADEAVNYLLYIVDVNELYNVALGTYDFDLVLMVAEKSQKDPKEYLPFLNNLQKYEDNYQRYMIDIHLKRYKKALQHISKCENRFEECLSLVTTHALYLVALKLFSVGSSQYKDINVAYGYYLLDQKQYDDAALIFYRCKEFEKALEAYEKSRNWRQVLCMASLLNYSSNKSAQLAQSLAGSLKERHQYSEAAILLEQYVQDVEESIATLIEGNEWDEALRIMHKYNRQDIIETHLKSALVEQSDETLFHLDRMRETYERHLQRLAIVRDLKQKGFYNAADQFQDGEGDLYSDTSSITGSRSSVQSQHSATNSKISGRSSKNRRKAERKKHSLKEGSPFEDVALIEALTEIIKLLDKIKDQIGSLLKTLFIFGYEKEASDIQEKMEVFLKFVADTQTQIWPGESEASQSDQIFGPNFTSNMIATNMQKIKESSSPKWQNPALKYPPELRKNISWKLDILKS